MSDGLTLEKLRVSERLGSLEVTVAETNVNLKMIAEILVELKDAKKVQNGRINKLENWRAYILGGAGMTGGLITFIYFVVDRIKH